MTSMMRSLSFTVLATAALAVMPVHSVDAQIYVSDVGSNTVKLYNQTTGAYIKTFVTSGSGGLAVPYGLTFDDGGNLYVSSLATHEVLRYNTYGNFVDKYVTKFSGGMSYPNQVAFGPNGDLYVASFQAGGNGQILEYQGPTGATPGAFVKVFASNPGLQGPTGFVFNSEFDGDLYVSSSTNNAIYRFNGITGALVGGGPLISGATSGLNGPAGLSFGPDGNLYVANFFPTSPGQPTGIVRYNLSLPGNPHSTFTGTLDINGPVTPVYGIDPTTFIAYLYVPSYRNNTIYRFNALTGAFDPTWSLIGGNLINPTYITIGPLPPDVAAPAVAVVPEPTSFALMGLGLVGVFGFARRRSLLKAA